MDGPIELVNSAENVNGRRGGTVYEVLSHDRMQDGEYMTIGSANEDDTGKHQAGQQGTNKKNEKIEKKLADQSKYLNILKLITIILTITVVITSVTFGVLIHKLVSSYY